MEWNFTNFLNLPAASIGCFQDLLKAIKNRFLHHANCIKKWITFKQNCKKKLNENWMQLLCKLLKLSLQQQLYSKCHLNSVTVAMIQMQYWKDRRRDYRTYEDLTERKCPKIIWIIFTSSLDSWVGRGSKQVIIIGRDKPKRYYYSTVYCLRKLCPFTLYLSIPGF